MIQEGVEVCIDEDIHNEFKMHTRNTVSEIPRKCVAMDDGRVVRTMQPSSKAICAFLNTDGGRIFLGIDDEGIIRGIRMTASMRDHFMLSLHRCLGLFTPAVPPELISVRFDEVHPKRTARDEQLEKKFMLLDSDSEDDGTDDEQNFELENDKVADWYVREHLIGGVKCPCDRMHSGSKLYLITLHIRHSIDGTIFQNDEGLAYRRRHGSNRLLCLDDLRKFRMGDGSWNRSTSVVQYRKVEPIAWPRRIFILMKKYFGFLG